MRRNTDLKKPAENKKRTWGVSKDDNLQKLLKNQNIYHQYIQSDEPMNWCDGCGNYTIQEAMIRALAIENIEAKDVVLAYDIGCSGNASDKLSVRSFHGLHGRVLPLSEGIHLGNPDLKIIAHAGDGATFGEGVNHLVHAIRNDYPILFIHHNNQNYALTTGQDSPTTQTTPTSINTLQFVLGLDPSCVLRSYSGDIDHMTQMMQIGLRHVGFTFLEIIQACPTYNKQQSHDFFRDNIEKIDHDVSDISKAREIVSNPHEQLPVGCIFKKII